TEIDSDIKCDMCNKNFSNANSLSRHVTVCKIKQDKIKIKDLENKVAELNNKLSSINITNNNTTNNTNNTNNINVINYITVNLTPYNDSNMKGMQQYLENAIRKSFLSVPTLIESVHFNDKYPENHNICITNKRTKD